jgi:hypothetical protein
MSRLTIFFKGLFLKNRDLKSFTFDGIVLIFTDKYFMTIPPFKRSSYYFYFILGPMVEKTVKYEKPRLAQEAHKKTHIKMLMGFIGLFRKPLKRVLPFF